MAKFVRSPIYDIANDILVAMSTSDRRYALEDESRETDVNGYESAGFTLVVDGKAYHINVTERKEG